MNELVVNDRLYKIASRLNINENSLNGTDASCTLMPGLLDPCPK